jgi:hypothetical protein
VKICHDFQEAFSCGECNYETTKILSTDGECMLDSKCNPLPVTGEVAKPSKVDSQRSPATPLDRKSVETSHVPGSQSTARSAQKGTRYVFGDFRFYWRRRFTSCFKLCRRLGRHQHFRCT